MWRHRQQRSLIGVRYGTSEDGGGLGELVADDMGVHAQRDRGARVAEPGGDDMDRDASPAGAWRGRLRSCSRARGSGSPC